MIKRIELVNFMSHERTVIEPADGLTVLIGPNNCGKSAFVAALQILCHNAKSSYVLRHGAKECEIIVETDDGHIVNWSRKKSGSPKYVINGEEFDRLRGGVPEELHQILSLGKVAVEKDQFDIHFGEQKSPIFLLDDSGKAAAQFFASSSDAIRLVEMQDKHKSKVRDSKRDQTRLTSEKQSLESDLEFLEPVESLDQRLAQCETDYKQIKKNVEQIEHIQILIKAFEEAAVELEKHSEVLNAVVDLPEPPVLADAQTLEGLIGKQSTLTQACDWSEASNKVLTQLAAPPKIENERQLETLIEEQVESERNLGWAQSASSVYGKLQTPPELVDELDLQNRISEFDFSHRRLTGCSQKFESLKRLQPAPELVDFSGLEKLFGEFSANQLQVNQATELLVSAEASLSQLNTELEAWVIENPTCPTCGSETKVEQLIGPGAERGGHRHG